MKLKKESLSYKIVTFILMLSVIFSSITNMFGNVKITNAEPNKSHAKDPNGIYYAYDKEERLRAITASTREKHRIGVFILIMGDTSFDGSKYTGTLKDVIDLNNIKDTNTAIKNFTTDVSGSVKLDFTDVTLEQVKNMLFMNRR